MALHSPVTSLHTRAGVKPEESVLGPEVRVWVDESPQVDAVPRDCHHVVGVVVVQVSPSHRAVHVSPHGREQKLGHLEFC